MRADLARRWNRWTAQADADGITDAYGQQGLAVRTMVEQGECFAHLIVTPRSPPTGPARAPLA